MKISNIMIGKKISKHLYRFDRAISPKDLLKIIKYLAHRGCPLSYIYNSDQLFYTKSSSISEEEFEYVYENVDKNLDYLLEKYTREDLADRVGSAMRIISSTTRTEIVQNILQDKNLIFRFFKQDFIEKYCSKWQDFKKDKTFIPSVSDRSKMLVFNAGCRSESLSGKVYLQYWRLGNRYTDFQLNRNFLKEMIDDNLNINLKNNDETIIKNTWKFIEINKKDEQFDLCSIYRSFDNRDLDILKAGEISYSTGIDALTEYFGLRKGSKFLTFSEGLKLRRDSQTVDDYLGKKFIIASDKHNIYCGIPHDKKLFEMIAWHLKLEYLKDKIILCKVTKDETQETITALWDIMNEYSYTGEFTFVEI